MISELRELANWSARKNAGGDGKPESKRDSRGNEVEDAK